MAPLVNAIFIQLRAQSVSAASNHDFAVTHAPTCRSLVCPKAPAQSLYPSLKRISGERAHARMAVC